MIRMSFSSKNVYDTCPAWFEYKYIKKEIGFEDPRHTLLGNTLDTYFDWFYKFGLHSVDWKKRLEEDVDYALEKNTEKFSKEDYVEFISSTREKCLELIPLDVAALKSNGIMAPRVYTQYDLEYVYDHPKKSFPIRFLGKADFILMHNSNDVRIYDGKASKYRHRNVHPEQLKLYALLFYLKHHVVASQLGFIYWSFPQRPVDYLYIEDGDFPRLLDDCFKTAEKILDNDFRANPAGHCYICPYNSRCKPGQEFRHKTKKSLPVIENDFMLEDFNGN